MFYLFLATIHLSYRVYRRQTRSEKQEEAINTSVQSINNKNSRKKIFKQHRLTSI